MCVLPFEAAFYKSAALKDLFAHIAVIIKSNFNKSAFFKIAIFEIAFNKISHCFYQKCSRSIYFLMHDNLTSLNSADLPGINLPYT